MPKRKTKTEFVLQANEKYKSKFKYRGFVYVNSRTKGRIVCPEHGLFWQTPDQHLHKSRKHGCPKCAEYTKADFIVAAKKVHGDTYILTDLTHYTGMNNQITVSCRLHGRFQIIANNFLRGSGCSSCFKERNTGGYKPILFEGQSFSTSIELAKAHGYEDNDALAAFLKRVPDFRKATEQQIRAAIDKPHVKRNKRIFYKGVKYPSITAFWKASQSNNSRQTIGRWIKEGIPPEVAIELPASCPEGFGLVYAIKHRNTGKKYVGQTIESVEKRWFQHRAEAEKGSSRLFHAAIKKYGPDSFTTKVLESNVERGAPLDACETKWIKQYNALHPDGFNMLENGKWGGRRGKLTHYNGVEYPSETAAAKAKAEQEGISLHCARDRLRRK